MDVITGVTNTNHYNYVNATSIIQGIPESNNLTGDFNI